MQNMEPYIQWNQKNMKECDKRKHQTSCDPYIF